MRRLPLPGFSGPGSFRFIPGLLVREPGISCSGVGDTGYGSLLRHRQPARRRRGYGGCLVSPGASDFIPSVGMAISSTTPIRPPSSTSVAGNGEIVRSPYPEWSLNPIPVIRQVIQTNNKFSPYLITCPLSPSHQLDRVHKRPRHLHSRQQVPREHLAARHLGQPHDLGRVYERGLLHKPRGVWHRRLCATDGLPDLLDKRPREGSHQEPRVFRPASVKGAPYNLSGSYNTKSYIFQPINSSPQQGIWTWTADYANLSNINLATSTSTTTPPSTAPRTTSTPSTWAWTSA